MEKKLSSKNHVHTSDLSENYGTSLYSCLIENNTLAFQEIVFIIFKNKTQQ